jgi:hypothetical protein
MQQSGEFIPKELNRAILDWAKENCSGEAVEGMGKLLLEHRQVFRTQNSVWNGVTTMMREDGFEEAEASSRMHLRCIDYLTFNELGTLVLELLDTIFTGVTDVNAGRKLREEESTALRKTRRSTAITAVPTRATALTIRGHGAVNAAIAESIVNLPQPGFSVSG